MSGRPQSQLNQRKLTQKLISLAAMLNDVIKWRNNKQTVLSNPGMEAANGKEQKSNNGRNGRYEVYRRRKNRSNWNESSESPN